MRPLSARRTLEAWERGVRVDAAGRALALLSVAYPESPREALAALSLGRREGALLRLRELSFGTELAGVSTCPHCAARLELSIDCQELGTADPGDDFREELLTAGGFELRYRLPDSRDLAAMAGCGSVQEARSLLLERCVLEAWKGGAVRAAAELPEEVVQALGERMEERDPLAEIRLDIECAGCGHRWLALLDVGSFLWAEVAAIAERLLYDVHLLARGYGWSESDILAMSAVRRQRYLDLLPAP